MKATVLLVDDEEVVRAELGGLLEDEGYRVLTAGDGEEGLGLFLRHRPDMVITDARMPRREGLSLAREILAQASGTPITMITGHGSEAMAIAALRLGITDFLKKPVELRDLLAALVRMEAARRLAAEGSASTLPAGAKLVGVARRYELGNEVCEIPRFVSAVVLSLASGLEPRKREGLQLALREVLINAVEHGNLGVTFEEKAEATEKGTLAALLAERAADPALAKRRVRVTTDLGPVAVSVVVEDEGEGFDWRKLPDPTDPSNLLRSHGRGVLLAALSVDELRFDDRGNRVQVVVLLRDGGGMASSRPPAGA